MHFNLTSNKSFCAVSGICGIIGVILLVISFNINPGPPPDASIEQLSAFAQRYSSSILLGAWLQCVGPVLIVVFAFALVKLANAGNRLTGMMTVFGASILMTVSLMEIAMYIGALFENPQFGGLISLHFIYSIQHLYFIVAAPAFFIPLGMVLIQSSILPKIFGWTGFLLGFLFVVLGIAFLQVQILPPAITALGGIQVFWWIAASISLILRASKM